MADDSLETSRDEDEASGAPDPEHGREAEKPASIPPRGWIDILWRTKQQVTQDALSIVAAGVAFYAFLAAIPALAALLALYAFFSEPSQVQEHIRGLEGIIPGEVLPMLEEQTTRMASAESGAGWGAILAIGVALYGASRGIKGLILGLNVAYHEEDRRNFFRLTGLSILMTLIAIVGGVLLFGLVAVLPGVLNFLGLGDVLDGLLRLLRWPLLLAIFLTLLALMYRFGPFRSNPQWRWASPGAILSTVLWAIGSVGFSIYVSHFGNYNKTYGALGAVVIFMLWLYLSAFVILLGAELNREMERQTRSDTTTGDPEPMGERGAFAADSLGDSRNGQR